MLHTLLIVFLTWTINLLNLFSQKEVFEHQLLKKKCFYCSKKQSTIKNENIFI